jgi:hypothetical protein
MPEDPEGSERLAEYGMTADEIELWFALGRLAGRFLQLPVLHPSERSETVIDIHSIQNRLLARPGLRATGWPTTTS